jgi:hypothetical protein
MAVYLLDDLLIPSGARLSPATAQDMKIFFNKWKKALQYITRDAHTAWDMREKMQGLTFTGCIDLGIMKVLH